MNCKRLDVAVATIATLACALLLAACGSSDNESTSTSTSAATATATAAADAAATTATSGAEEVVIGHVSPNLSNPTLAALDLGQKRAAQQLGWSVRTVDAGLSPDRQVSSIDTLINLRVGALTTWVLDPGPVDAALGRTRDADIPVVTFNSPSELVNTNIKTELSTSCKPFSYEADYIAERIPGASVLVIGSPPVPALQFRIKCFTDAAKAAGLKVLDREDNMEDSAARSQAITQDLLTKYPDTDAVWAYNDPTAIGAAAAVTSAGRDVWSGDKEGVIVIGNNGDADAIAAIRAGALTLTYDENTFEAGAAAVEVLVPVLRDGKPVSSMPAERAIPSDPVDASNVEEWVAPEERAAQVG
ncbi:sugar ABC transporter substrate-binding protein [Capillimicrobium parvum]|uniref:Ribose import binding protein RbsB n=1 Tax=Capillimicrobium parvum TaxID=2884022 RepID=A0A9E6XT75_9ACTN|nr:sugar ABC transporter substrate-binding protein [Capillimicrobium parvum]UGS33835.1 Ribose import binding protein RbsB [Capillimicrobium parvum]